MPRRKKSEAEVQPEAVTEQVQQIAISELHPFEGHPFKVLDDETIPRLRGAGYSVGDEDYRFSYRLAIWFNSSSGEYVMNWR